MSTLQERLGIRSVGKHPASSLYYENFGLLANPFPSSGETSNHPRMRGEADDNIEERLRSFIINGQSQVVVVTGEQGVGKTNLLEHYRKELPKAFDGQSGYYVIRYLADPEPKFTGVVLKILDELGMAFLRSLVTELMKEVNQDKLSTVESAELREALKRITSIREDSELNELRLKQFSEYLHGQRVGKAHYEGLGLRFSLTSLEQKTLALREIIKLAMALKLVKGIFLFMDELEKLGSMTLKNTIGYLSAIRALIDALPGSLFLALAMTNAAGAQYRRLFPSLAGRLGNPIDLKPLESDDDATRLGTFYINVARRSASEEGVQGLQPGMKDVVSLEQMRTTFEGLRTKQATGRGLVNQREFLNELHQIAQKALDKIAGY